MSSAEVNQLSAFSDQLVSLVSSAARGVAAVRPAAHRVVSAVVIGEDLLATTDHTLRREEGIGVVLADGREAKGSLVGRHPGLDVALIRAEGLGLQPLPAAAAVKAGSLVAVLGLAADVGPSVSLGIVGAVGGERKTWRGGKVQQFTRLDVNLYPSQFGAAVLDMQGGLVGLATPALLRHSAVAVSFSDLQRVAQELLREGRIRQGYLGVGLQQVAIPERMREHSGVDARTGLMLLSVEEDSPAAHSGLQLGDILLSLGGVPTGEAEDLQDVLRGDVVDQTREAVLIRGGEVQRLSVLIRERKAASRKGE